MAVLLAQRHEVVALDIVPAKVDLINQKLSPIQDAELQDYLTNKPLRLRATLDKQDAYVGADFVITATPADNDPVPITSTPARWRPCSGRHGHQPPGGDGY